MNYITPNKALNFEPLSEEYFHLADTFTCIPCSDGGDEVKYFLCHPENLKQKKHATDNTNIFLIKEKFAEYIKQLREEKAKEYGMTLEEWDNAIINQLPVTCSNSSTN